MSGGIKLRVAEIQRFCMHDGPGVRTTVFLAGCPLRCEWCHNPEMRSASPTLLYYRKKCVGCGVCAAVCPRGVHAPGEEPGGHTIDREKCVACGACADACPAGALSVCGREMTVDEIVDAVLRDRAFYGETGGVTLSGGEPTVQAEGAVALLRACREAGIGTAIETCGFFDGALLDRLVPLVDLFLWDVKDTDAENHLRHTGAPLAPIIDNLRRADALGAATRLRCILVAGVNDGTGHWERVAALRRSLRGCVGVDVLPYHTFGAAKAEFAGLAAAPHDEWVPSDEQIARARAIVGA